MAKKKSKYYVVWKGHRAGIFESWDDCKAQIKDYKGAQYKSFTSFDAAKKALKEGPKDYMGKSKTFKSELSDDQLRKIGEPNFNSISVDAASSGNPGKMEYRGVDTKSKKQLFIQGPFEEGTNNIGEFLALVHGISLLKKKGLHTWPSYSDSKIAMSWIKKKTCRTNITFDASNSDLLTLIQRAEKWLKENSFRNPILKWETKAWGEIPADFGRK